METNPLIKDNSVLVKTPLRDDARPLSGLFHQAYVLCGLSRFYSKILNINEYGNMDNVIKRANIQYNDYSFSLKVLSENSSFLTESGIQLLEMMLDDLKIYK
jgi:HEXXH motif-containing protein